MTRPPLRAIEGGRASPGRRATGAWGRGGPAHAGLLGSALAGAEAFFLEPAEPREPTQPTSPAAPVARRPVLAVHGLACGCGSTTVARALAAELAQRDPSGAGAVMCDARASAIPLATHAAGRLARVLEQLPGADARPVGRLALVSAADPLALTESSRGLAPLVFDAGASALGGVPAALADRCLLITTPALEPALARVAAECLARIGPPPLVVLNRGRAGEARAGDGPPAVSGEQGGELTEAFGDDLIVLPDSRMGAQLALGGREARGDLGRAVATLADRCPAAEHSDGRSI